MSRVSFFVFNMAAIYGIRFFAPHGEWNVLPIGILIV